MSRVALKTAREIAGRVTAELGGRGIFGVELFIKGHEVWFSEVSPRPHDTGLVTMCTQVQSEFDLHARAILGLPVDTRLSNPARRRSSTAASTRAAFATKAWPTRCACPGPTSGCSASRRATSAGAWAWHSRAATTSRRRASARRNARGACCRAPDRERRPARDERHRFPAAGAGAGAARAGRRSRGRRRRARSCPWAPVRRSPTAFPTSRRARTSSPRRAPPAATARSSPRSAGSTRCAWSRWTWIRR